MSNEKSIASEERGCVDALRAQVEQAAVQLVLGKLDSTERLSLLKGIGESARMAGRTDVERIAAETVEAVSTAESCEAEALFSSCLTRIQQALRFCEECVTDRPAAEVSGGFVPLSEDRELLGDFILESRDHLTQVELQMITLEKNPADAEAINTVFRAFHTIKGLAGFLDLTDMQETAHETETLLDMARNRKLAISPAVVDVVLASADFLKASLLRLEQQLAGVDAAAPPDNRNLIERLRCAAAAASADALAPPVEQNRSDADGVVGAAQLAGDGTDWVEADRRFGEDRRKKSMEWTGPERRRGEDRRAQPTEAHSVKVDTAKLDYLVDMAGELVIAESMLRHQPELIALHSPAVLHSMSQLARITSDLQKTAMSMRMVPIGGLFQRMNRLVRDMARKTCKQAELEAVGSETELDRNVVEELADPLVHMIRNAIDHGLETEQERVAAGKNPVGRVRLRAFHQAGHVVIEVSDDGRGLNRCKIIEKARRMGLLDEACPPGDAEVNELIFHPGFSTASEVTDVSGRGVGMDVVKKKIQNLRGRVEIHSTPGAGTTFLLRLPLTLAIIDGLVVGVGRERYVIPIFSVREMLRPSVEMVFTVEGRQEMVMVRDTLLPMVRLYKRFGVRPRSEEPCEGVLIVADAGGRSFCLMVDDLIGKQEVVIKALGETIQQIPGIAGGAILGDGRVGLILDLEGVFRKESE